MNHTDWGVTVIKYIKWQLLRLNTRASSPLSFQLILCFFGAYSSTNVELVKVPTNQLIHNEYSAFRAVVWLCPVGNPNVNIIMRPKHIQFPAESLRINIRLYISKAGQVFSVEPATCWHSAVCSGLRLTCRGGGLVEYTDFRWAC